MADSKRISSAKVRSVALALHRKAVAGGKAAQRVKITPGVTATGGGIVRFRASKVLDSYRSTARARVQKARPVKSRAAR